MLTLADIKDSVARIMGANTADPRVAEYVSRAQERLLHNGKWVGTYGRYRVCVNDSCLTWPREIETIEAAALCDRPISVRNEWFEFLGSGPGVQAENCGICHQLVDRGNAVAFDDVKGTGKKLAVYSDGTEAAGAQILLRYYNSNGIKVYTTDSNNLPIEGEYINLPAGGGYAYSTYEVLAGGFYDAVKPVTKRTTRIYEYTVAGGALKPLAYYEPDETNPSYRRSLVPGISDRCNGVEPDSDCGASAIDIVGKFRNRAVRKDSDALLLTSGEAIRLMVQAIMAEENNLDDLAKKREGAAVSVLDSQLRHWLGSGASVPIRIIGPEVIGPAVLNLI